VRRKPVAKADIVGNLQPGKHCATAKLRLMAHTGHVVEAFGLVAETWLHIRYEQSATAWAQVASLGVQVGSLRCRDAYELCADIAASARPVSEATA
jgi:hypothetical protein